MWYHLNMCTMNVAGPEFVVGLEFGVGSEFVLFSVPVACFRCTVFAPANFVRSHSQEDVHSLFMGSQLTCFLLYRRFSWFSLSWVEPNHKKNQRAPALLPLRTIDGWISKTCRLRSIARHCAACSTAGWTKKANLIARRTSKAFKARWFHVCLFISRISH